ncbi:MAG TPA: nicotinate (nicotinamide) nucleotide adenylyltransferase [Fervidobacterium sp.]|nr:nicotinate (nicotinamide) nucleotide adenylyltransferase [Fervidobacterium sp.]HOV53118.1 nicotinate (nicotinamide) nucleotide adenylyltransferase [Fervidobacterium sp.]HPC79096.1 nicotinate (nicotinamide) nucleotide adenylyltransferase [Fervidobacterium sp.]HQI93696.1 nicotinate (nicotinamide) nucleotide adenylyltransferase [Fervidobacterium sp.]HRT02237.1 nicotinate (nicotinamide) nucleotide adenylyltransferase [Fervidobacterium sp.]
MEILYGLRELNSLSKSKTAVVYGGSFNPPHFGHIAILSYAFDFFDADFYIVPTRMPPHKKVHVSFEERFRWASKVFSSFEKDNLFVTDMENHIEGMNYAIKNVDYFIQYYEEVILLVGEDALGNIESWYEYEKLLSLAKLAVYPRTRDGSLYKRGKSVLGQLYSRVVELNFPLFEVSSSDIRERIREGKSVVGLLPECIRKDVEMVYSVTRFFEGGKEH